MTNTVLFNHEEFEKEWNEAKARIERTRARIEKHHEEFNAFMEACGTHRVNNTKDAADSITQSVIKIQNALTGHRS